MMFFNPFLPRRSGMEAGRDSSHDCPAISENLSPGAFSLARRFERWAAEHLLDLTLADLGRELNGPRSGETLIRVAQALAGSDRPLLQALGAPDAPCLRDVVRGVREEEQGSRREKLERLERALSVTMRVARTTSNPWLRALARRNARQLRREVDL